MSLDLLGRCQTRFAVFIVLLPLTAVLAAWADLGARPGAAALFVLFWLPLGLVAESVYAVAQRLRREGDWPLLHVVYGLALEAALLFALMRADMLPLLPDCLQTTQDLALRRAVCVSPSLSDAETIVLAGAAILVTLVMHGLILPVLWPRWRRDAGRLLPRRRRS